MIFSSIFFVILLSARVQALSSIGVIEPACRTVSGVISPTPSSAICGTGGTSYALAGAGTIVGYTSGSPYVASLEACSTQCLANALCTNIYFIQGQNCNLHYGPDAFHTVGSVLFQFYDRSCFTCETTPTSATTTKTTTTCSTVSVVSPTPSSAICGTGGTSYALAGAGTIVGYTSGSPYVASLEACSAQCLANALCTNIYFIQGQNCNLHYGPDAFHTAGSVLFQFYDRSCFACDDASSVPAPTACKTVSGVISPTPSGATCGAKGSSYSLTGTGVISDYTAGSVYVSSMAACAALCLATTACTNIYFIQGSNCNLHYGPKAFIEGVGSYNFYDVSCFTCPEVLLPTTSSGSLLTSSTSKISTSAPTTTSAATTAICNTVSGLSSPAPTGAICGARGSGYAMEGTGTLASYGAGSPYVASLAACSAQCLATSCCTNIYFISGSYCNLHFGPIAFSINTGNPLFDFYDARCFTCESLSCATKTSYNMALTTTFTPPAQCTHGALTQMAYSNDAIWVNAIIPVPTSTITSCYPTQFADSVIASAVASSKLPPFSELVCPFNWETFYYNSTYIICCPTNFNVLLPNYNEVDRPGLHAICTSRIFMDVLMDLTSYDATAYATVVATSAPSNGAIVLANAFDGTALHPRPTAATTTAT